MNSMLIIASLIAVAVATPVHRLVAPGITGPEPVVGNPIGSAILDFEPIAVGPAIANIQPAEPSTLIKIILNINSETHEILVPIPVDSIVVPSPVAIGTPVAPEVQVPGAVNVVDSVDNIIVPSPVVIGTPVAPEVQVPGAVNVVEGIDSIEAVSTPIIASPAVVNPEILN